MQRVATTRGRFTITYWTDRPDKRTPADKAVAALRKRAKEHRQ